MRKFSTIKKHLPIVGAVLLIVGAVSAAIAAVLCCVCFGELSLPLDDAAYSSILAADYGEAAETPDNAQAFGDVAISSAEETIRGGAYAAETTAINFTIRTADGVNFDLFKEASKISSESGNFFELGGGSVSEVFYNVIHNELSDGQDYSLAFEFPAISCTVSGPLEFPYSDTDAGGIKIKFEYDPVITAGSKVVQYRTADGEYMTYAAAEDENGLSFGKRVPVGEYFVRAAVIETFVFDRREYSVPRYAEEIKCTVLSGSYPLSEIPEVSAVYGTRADGLSSRIVYSGGRFELASGQSGINPDTLLPVEYEAREVLFDFYPENSNFAPVKNVPVSVRITPAPIRVYICDGSSLVGVPLNENISFDIVSELVGDDSIEDLGAKLDFSAVNANTAGRYLVKVTFANANYNPVCFNKDPSDMFTEGGHYSVLQTKLSGKAADGSTFEIIIEDGFIGYSLEVQDFGKWELEDYKMLGSYSFVIKDENGEEVILDSYTVSYKLAYEAGLQLVIKDGKYHSPDYAEGTVKLTSFDDGIAFFESALEDEDYIAGILLAIFLFFAIIYTAVAIDRYNRKKQLMAKSGVYERKMREKTPNGEKAASSDGRCESADGSCESADEGNDDAKEEENAADEKSVEELNENNAENNDGRDGAEAGDVERYDQRHEKEN